MRLLRRADIETALPMQAAIRLMGQAFAAISNGSAHAMERQALATSTGHALFMGASGVGLGTAAKLVTVIPANKARGLPVSIGLAVLVNELDGQPLALFDATSLTAWRTAAAVGFATSLLSRESSRTGLMIGCGTQARTQLLAMDAARRLEEIRVFGRDPRQTRSLIEAMQPALGVRLTAVADLGQSVREADIITAATTSSSPVIDGADVPAGCHVNGIGSFRPDMCEFDQVLVARAGIYVEARATAAAEAGELVAALRSGVTDVADWREIGEVVEGDAPGRLRENQVTFFKSVGHAVFDLFAASIIQRESVATGLGTEWIL
jgi:ornithine cyclodeaminase